MEQVIGVLAIMAAVLLLFAAAAWLEDRWMDHEDEDEDFHD